MKKMPQRKCVGCGLSTDKINLIRVVRSPVTSETLQKENNVPRGFEVSIDLKGKKSGRGAYICKSEDCLKKALKARKFERSLEIKISEELAESLLNQIKEN